MKKQTKNGFTLVELLAVIVILAIILVIAVPKVMSVIEDSKKATLESTAKMIASSAEKQKVQNTVLGNSDAITCDSVAKINSGDYASCSIEFDDNTAKVTIEGSGKFAGLYVCSGTKTSAIAQEESCTSPIEVKHPLFLKGQELTPDMFEVSIINDDGSKRILENGTGFAPNEIVETTAITSPNWPENYPKNIAEEESYWEATYEDAVAIQITFDETSELGFGEECGEICDEFGECWNDCWDMADFLKLYGNESLDYVYHIDNSDNFSGKTYIIKGNYIKVYMSSYVSGKGFSATISPMYSVPAEYTVSPSVVPNTEGNFDITITVNGQNISKEITTSVGPHDVEDYVASHKGFDTVQTTAEYNGTTYDAGIRYVGELDEVKNKVYYNCEDTDSNGIAYGTDNYDYASSCETWRIIGVFDTKTSTGATPVKRVKLINTASTFTASWDSSLRDNNGGRGINQWGEINDANGNITYAGADLMQLLNGYYISTENSTCTYCNASNQETCSQLCTAESLKSANMKVLTSIAKGMIGNAVWDTYAVKYPDDNIRNLSWAPTAYLEERGISVQNTGKNLCEANDAYWCTDSIERTTSWTGLVGLMSVSDILYADGWLDNKRGISIYQWSITPFASEEYPCIVWINTSDGVNYMVGYGESAYSVEVGFQGEVISSIYLKSNIKIIGGNGDTEPYKLAF